MENQAEENIEVTKFCESMEELIKSEDFTRGMNLLLKKRKKYNEEYYLGIINKIRREESLENSEKEDMKAMLEDEKIREIGDRILKTVKGFTIEEVGYFLNQYPVEKIINELKRKTICELKGLISFEFIKELDIQGKIYVKGKLGDKFGYVKVGEEETAEDKFIFDRCELEEVNGDIFIEGRIGEKRGYVKVGEEERAEEKCVFNQCDLVKINGDIYIRGYIGYKIGYVKYGEEKKVKEKCIFTWCEEFKKNGDIYIKGMIGVDKEGYVKYGEEKKAIELFVKGDSLIDGLQEDEKGIFFYEKVSLFKKKKVYVTLFSK